MNGGVTKCPVERCKSYFVCPEDLEEHVAQLHAGFQPTRGITRSQPDGREETLSSAFEGLSAGGGIVADARRTNATTLSRGTSTAEPNVPTTRGTLVYGNTDSQVFLGGSAASKSGQSTSGGVSITGNKGSQVFCAPTGSSSTSRANQNKPGGLTVIGNKGVQLCFTSSGSSSASSDSQSKSGFTVISENENMQLLSDGSTGHDMNVCKNKDLQLLNSSSTSGAAPSDVIVKDNEKSQVFIPPGVGNDTSSETQRDGAEGAPESMTPEDAQD